MMQRDNTDLCFTPLAPQQVPALAALCADAPDPWTAPQLAAELAKPQSRVFVASSGQTPVAFAAFGLVGDTAELEQLAVAAQNRRTGVASALLTHAFGALQLCGARRCLLEVRASNTAALALYHRMGFAQLARRSGLYAAPHEDGFTMELVFHG